MTWIDTQYNIVLQKQDPKQNALFIEKALALVSCMNDKGQFPGEPDLQDPLDDKLVRVEEVLSRNNLNRRADYSEVLLELTILVLMYDRTLNSKYAVSKLLLSKEDTEKLAPPIKVS